MSTNEEEKLEEEIKCPENESIKYARNTLSSLSQRDESKFPTKIFHNAKGIGIIQINYDEMNAKTENIGNGVIFTHWKNNEKKASGPIFINVMMSDDYNKSKLTKFKGNNTFLIILKEEAQIYDLCEEKHHNIKLGIDYNIEGIVKDDYDGILIFEITHLNHHLKSISDIDCFRDLIIQINNPEMHVYYNNNKFSMKDVYEGTISIPLNGDYVECERLINEKFMIHFTEHDIKKGKLGHNIRAHHKMHDTWYKSLFERPIDRLMKYYQPETTDDNLTPYCNVIEKTNEYEIECELPGIDKNNIHVNFHSENGTLEIEGKREKKECNDNCKIQLAEINYGNYYRHLILPKSVHLENNRIKAKHFNGVLTIIIPKHQSALHDEKSRVNIE